VVDDDRAITNMLCEMLASQGYEPRGCTSGEEALGALRESHFDAIISDLKMPGVSGTALLQQACEKYPHTAFVIVTGVDDARIGIEAMKQGADDYLIKPFQLQGIVASVERALQKRRLQRELDDHRRNLEEKVSQRTKQLEAAMRRIELTYDETLEALGAALDLRDTETAGHSRRVSRYCEVLARKIGCTEEQLRQIARGSYLHDIGKIGTPDAILLKPGKLTEEETTIMQRHARIGYDLVSRIAFLAPAAEIVLTHQERFDGTGYPQGLVGREIPLGARVFAVADTLDAMTSDRPYRRALPYSTAREEIGRESGSQFDPDVVRTFLSVPEQVWTDIRAEVAGTWKPGSISKQAA
jgi:putative nucleotidyltransferase with HDIG domain